MDDAGSKAVEVDVLVDVLIVGGGIAGMWALDALRRRGVRCLLVEKTALGDGQTVWSQGIIHSGLKYTLGGALTGSASAIADLPEIWKACVAGGRQPDLSGEVDGHSVVRSPFCFLWRTESLMSQAGMIGARLGLKSKQERVGKDERPAVLKGVPGTVAKLDEVVLSPARVLGVLAERNAGALALGEVQLAFDGDGVVGRVAREGESFVVRAKRVVLTAGNGNAELRGQLGLEGEALAGKPPVAPGVQIGTLPPTPSRWEVEQRQEALSPQPSPPRGRGGQSAMQVRLLRMVLVRGASVEQNLPELNGHCVDGAKTRATITSDVDAHGRVVWQVGGEVAERGAGLSAQETIALAKVELGAVLPGVDLSRCVFATYDAPRAEGKMAGGKRPEREVILEDGPVITVWPTKLVTAPRVAERLIEMVGDLCTGEVPVPPRGRSALAGGGTQHPLPSPPPVGEGAESRNPHPGPLPGGEGGRGGACEVQAGLLRPEGWAAPMVVEPVWDDAAVEWVGYEG